MNCTIASGALDKDGYGQRHHKGHNVKAHRLAYADAHGLDVLTMCGVVMHACDNPACINPEHLSLGSTQDNVDDKVAKGRHRTGTQMPTSKLSEEQVRQIKALYIPRQAGSNQRALAQLFGVSQRTIVKVLHNASYIGHQ